MYRRHHSSTYCKHNQRACIHKNFIAGSEKNQFKMIQNGRICGKLTMECEKTESFSNENVKIECWKLRSSIMDAQLFKY